MSYLKMKGIKNDIERKYIKIFSENMKLIKKNYF